MAYNTEDLIKQALKAIEEHKLFFIEDIVCYLPCSKPTFYEHKLNEVNDIKEALLKVRTNLKVSMRSKWYKSDSAALQMGLMKLISTNDERRMLSQTHHEITDGSKVIKGITFEEE